MSVPKSHLSPVQDNAIPIELVYSADEITISNVNHTFKRVFDLVVASVLLFILSPVMLVTAILVKATSGGPIIYKQTRVTRGQETFEIFKFRTMVNNAEATTGPTWVGKNDARVTPLGELLRQTHVDEFPQLFNVLKGDMSIIGPRPERPVFVEQFKDDNIPNYEDRFLTKAGLMGYAQINNPNPVMDEIHLKTQDDVWYVRNWSVMLDFQILWRTGLYFANSLLSVARRQQKQRA